MRLLDQMGPESQQTLGVHRLQRTRFLFLSRQAENYRVIGHFQEAERYLDQAHALAESSQIPDVALKHSLQQATILSIGGDYPRAYERLQSAIDLAQQTNQPDPAWQCQYLLGNWLRQTGRPKEALAAYQQSIRIIETMGLYVPDRELQMSFLAHRYDPYRAMVTLYHHELQDDTAALGYYERSKTRVLLNRWLTKMLGTANAENVLCEPPRMLSLLQHGLPSDLLIVEFFTRPSETLVFIIGAHVFHCLSLPVGRDQLASLEKNFLNHLRNGHLAESRRAGEELYNRLIHPIKSYLTPQSTLCIIPDEGLFNIPFPALITEGGQFLIKEYRITHAFSATSFKWLLSLNKGPTSGKTRKVLTIAADEHLEEARKEAWAIYQFYKPQAQYLRQPDRSDLAARVDSFEILHFAGHANVGRDGSSILVFAPVESAASRKAPMISRPEPIGDRDRMLRTDDVMRWNLSNVRLVTLSACGTSLGKYWQGEGIVGLPYAFLSAGAPALLASLWEVDGAATRQLMEQFYTHLQTSGTSKAEALRQAQLDLINSQGSYQSPYYWASFILFGDPR